MLSKVQLKKIVHALHLENAVESFKEFQKDNRGGFLIPSQAKLYDPDFERYRHLKINWRISEITADDLPKEFSPQAVKTVDMFRRKTVDLPYECMILFDYRTGRIVSCNFSDESEDKVESEVYEDLLKNYHIASIHNHPNQYFSPPSGKNFQMLGLKFEEFELISSKNELWILKSDEMIFDDEVIMEIRNKANDYFNLCFDDINIQKEGYELLDCQEKLYGDMLLNYINNNFENIKLTRRFLNE